MAPASAPGAITTSVKIPAISSAVAASSGWFSATMPAESGGAVAIERLPVGFGKRLAPRHAARVGVFDDRAGRAVRRVEFADQLESGIGVVDVVVGQLLALMLARGGDAGPGRAIGVEGRLLVRVLAVAQRLRERAAEDAAARACSPIAAAIQVLTAVS